MVFIDVEGGDATGGHSILLGVILLGGLALTLLRLGERTQPPLTALGVIIRVFRLWFIITPYWVLPYWV